MSEPLSRDPSTSAPAAGWRDYWSLARPNHWIKHIFILPGIVLAAMLLSRSLVDRWQMIVLGLVSSALIASANYVLNEWLDAAADAFHPIKRRRPAVSKRLSPAAVGVEYSTFAAAGLLGAWVIGPLFLVTAALFLVSGWIYNVPPLRSKDVAYLDVLSESFNNPLRLTLGWAMIDSHTLPPASLLLGYWMGGAFLMAVKRLAELRALSPRVPASDLGSYRRSFSRYTESSLLVSSLIYAMLSGFFVAIFFVKYRIEYLLALPALALLFGAYLRLGLQEGSRAQTPEKLFRETLMLAIALLLVLLLLALTLIDLPALQRLVEPHYISLP